MSDETPNTHGYRMLTGRHKGERITRVPVSYLKWMVNSDHSEAIYAEAELARRGTVTPELDLSGHAIDRASQTCLKVWKRTRHEGEGLHAWLLRMCAEALKQGHPRNGKTAYQGMFFVFATDGVWPVLQSIMRDDRPRKDLRPMRERDDELQA